MPLPTSKLKAAEAKKIEAERLQGFLQEMLREEENKYCADCEQKQPRWASWNLGVFLCIRCAGLHRNLGVHISRVKSVTLDSWTPEQVQSMRVMGNAKARAVYENELPALFRRPQTDQSLEQFIRAKYEAKRYIMKGWISPSVDVNDLPALPEAMIRDKKATLMTGQSEKHNPSKFSHQLAENAHDKRTQQKPSPPLSAKAIVPQLIDFDFTPAPTQTIADSVPEQKDMNNMDDIFGPIVSAAPVNLPQQQQHLSTMNAGIPTSISSPNLTNTVNANSNNLITNIFNTNADLQSQQQTRLFDGPTSTAIPNHRIDLMGNFGATQSHTATATNPPQHIPQSQPQPTAMHSSLVGSDLMGLDMSMCTLNTGQSQSASTMLSSPPPATDTKKSTNEILALFKK